MNSSTKLIATFILGAAAGVAIGFYLAADDKEEFISDIKDAANKVKVNLETQLEKGKKIVDELKDKMSDLLDEA